ncbi:D-cysteine desulfhydrase family protein [Mycolicibacterium sp. 018/SC-01/001]|nr:D-cysteine desulfhydrase family protein [Mycolicibacterium sp. 018/SC-01/001]
MLASWPTPLEPAPRLSVALGLNADDLWLKRDDLTGLAAGGNKIRKLEWTIAAAQRQQADVVITTGAPQSNHARLTVAACARAGLDVVLVFPGAAPRTSPAGNLLLDTLLGASLVWSADRGVDAKGQDELDDVADEVAQELRAEGRRPVVIPFGGSNAVGAHGYRLAAGEITLQRDRVDEVVCAVGSGGTMAGLVAGLGAERVLGVDCGAVSDAHAQVAALLQDMGTAVPHEQLRIRTDQVGAGYEVLTDKARAAMTLAARTHGLVLDPTYSARALAGLIDAIEDGTIRPGRAVIFLTSGGLPGLFGHPDMSSS